VKAKICLTDQAANILRRQNIDPEAYGSAYLGESAGLDLYNMGDSMTIPGKTKWAQTGERPILFPTGLRVVIPNGYVGLILERGSIVKTGLSLRAGVIDPGFTGEIFVSFLNVGERDTIIETGAKLPAQLVVTPCAFAFEVISKKDYDKQMKFASRKEKMIGSTN